MAKEVKDIKERTFEFAVRIVKLCQYLDKTPGACRTLSGQLLRAEHQLEPTLKKHKPAKAERISLARIPSR